jgi:inhibitor of cysteine peptidase
MTACAPAATGQPDAVIQKDQDGQTIQLSKGSAFTISLPGNPTTGYSWEVSEIDPKVIEQDGDWTFKAESDKIGAPGMLALPFKAAGSGQCTLKLIYHRSFEKDVPPADTFSVTIVVK